MTEFDSQDDESKQTFSQHLDAETEANPLIEKEERAERQQALNWLKEIEVSHNEAVDRLEESGRPQQLRTREDDQEDAGLINYLREQVGEPREGDSAQRTIDERREEIRQNNIAHLLASFEKEATAGQSEIDARLRRNIQYGTLRELVTGYSSRNR